ncbi:MAG: maleylacetoacetate isomerase [Betaproteobacteria bacterium]|nr:MAG: maleylacetoacetate isomerase [Betaproteobacteria bacterium]
MKLYNYFRSSAAYRVRIALNLKGIDWEHVGVHLVKREQRSPEYLKLNPAGLVPALVDDDENVLTQSIAIMEYLDDLKPRKARLVPADPIAKAYVRALSLSLACDVHPLNNVRVLNYLTAELNVTQAQKDAWIAYWITTGLDALENTLANERAKKSALAPGNYCVGDAPTLADCVLVPQVFSARRFNVDVSKYPLIEGIDAHCSANEAFAAAHPGKQPDFQP